MFIVLHVTVSLLPKLRGKRLMTYIHVHVPYKKKKKNLHDCWIKFNGIFTDWQIISLKKYIYNPKPYSDLLTKSDCNFLGGQTVCIHVHYTCNLIIKLTEVLCWFGRYALTDLLRGELGWLVCCMISFIGRARRGGGSAGSWGGVVGLFGELCPLLISLFILCSWLWSSFSLSVRTSYSWITRQWKNIVNHIWTILWK